MIDLSDIWQAPAIVVSCKLCWDLYSLAKDIVIDNYIRYRKDSE